MDPSAAMQTAQPVTSHLEAVEAHVPKPPPEQTPTAGGDTDVAEDREKPEEDTSQNNSKSSCDNMDQGMVENANKLADLVDSQASTVSPDKRSVSSPQRTSAVSMKVAGTFRTMVIDEFFFKTIPMFMFGLAVAAPTFLLDAIFSYGFHPQSGRIPANPTEVFTQANPANFTLHYNYMLWSDSPDDALADMRYLGVAYGGFWAGLFVIPVVSFCLNYRGERWRSAIGGPIATTAVLLIPALLAVILVTIGMVRSSSVDAAPHTTAVAGAKGSHSYFVTLLLLGSALLISRRFSRKLNDPTVGMYLLAWCLACLVFVGEALGLVQNPKLEGDKKDVIIFVYRAVFWPLIWLVVIGSLWRQAARCWAQSGLWRCTAIVAMHTVIWGASSRYILFDMQSQLFFTILAFWDRAVLFLITISINRIDDFMMRRVWRRFPKDVTLTDAEKVEIQTIFFQVGTVMEIASAFTQTVRQGLYWENRFVFASLYSGCESELDMGSLGFELFISLLTIIAEDAVTSVYFTKAKVPLDKIFNAMVKSREVWLYFLIGSTWFNFLYVTFSTQNLSRAQPACTSWDSVCDCVEGVSIFQQLCGLC
eukprot:TRINITY_DN81383_c0_g1_i1.p1 TRINITY_DN81383_c0_g1~~TRINITY_DN81383_c0_g1_i1.p1  ORF type:complete len:591 (-),score=101.79 TRINITY_DN81383_c0_g1_i1:461-2233(-)